MAFRPADVIGVIWSHPIVSVVVLLLFTPPLFPILVYFSPLLISTALFVLAMISMGSDVDETPTFTYEVPYKRGWIEDVDDGPQLDGERVPKRLKASSKDESWFDKVKNWEGTGRAWVESVLSQESRRSVSSDDYAFTREGPVPLLAAREFFMDENRRRSPEADGESKAIESIAEEKAPVISDGSALSASVEKSESVGQQPVPADGLNVSSEIIPELESDDGLIEISPMNIPHSPPFRSRSLPKADATGDVASNGLKTQDASSKDPQAVLSGSCVPDTEEEEEKKTASGLDSSKQNDRKPAVAAQDQAERVPGGAGNMPNAAEISPVSDDEASNVASSVQREKSHGTAGEAKSETKGVSSNVGADRNLVEKGQTTNSATPEAKSAAELQGKAYGLGTPSAAVALSEKLKVPLAEFMSLLAGDDKENVPNEGASGVKVSSSSETTTTSQEEEWSSSDGESSAPLKSAEGPPVEKKDV